MGFWTYKHFITLVPAVICMIVITFVLNRLLRDKPLKIRMIPFKIIAFILLVSEIIKQVISIKNGYDFYHIPLHVCSLFIILIPLMAFYNKKGSDTINAIACTVCVSLLLFLTIYPNLIYSAGNIDNFFTNYFDFHTVFFHNLVLFEFFLIIGLNLYSTNGKRYTKQVVIASLAYAVTAAITAQILKTNFSNFYECNIEPVRNLVNVIKAQIGNILGQILYVSVMIILHVGFFTLSYYIYILIEKFKFRKKIK